MAASTAFPPAEKIAHPASAASAWGAATMPRVARAWGQRVGAVTRAIIAVAFTSGLRLARWASDHLVRRDVNDQETRHRSAGLARRGGVGRGTVPADACGRLGHRLTD